MLYIHYGHANPCMTLHAKTDMGAPTTCKWVAPLTFTLGI